MKAILVIVTILGLAAATTVYGAQQAAPDPQNRDQATAQEREQVQDRANVLTQAEHHEAAQDRDRTRTPDSEAAGMPGQDQDRTNQRDQTRIPGSEPSAAPQQGRDQDTLQKRDQIHTPGTMQPGARPRTAPNAGSGSSRGGGRRR